MRWLVLSYSLPSKPSSSRVTLWRRLQRLGALSVTGAHLLPQRPDCGESFTWFAQEVRAAGGEALVMEVERFEGLSEREVVERFNGLQEEAYAALQGAIEAFEKAQGEDNPLKTLDRLRQRFLELKRLDFFGSPAGKEVAAKLTELEQTLLPGAAERAQVATVDRADYQNRTWVTRPQPHVDRLASVWLIARFIDPSAKILYRNTAKESEVSFDMDGAVFTHTGSLCTFETLIAAFALEDSALTPVAQIVHEIDLRDGRYVRAEVAGLDALLDGWLASGLSDEELEARGRHLFSGLYAAFSQADKDHTELI